MIPDALIVPSECAPTSLDIKRALLSYNKVLIVSPSDRDVIPSRTFGLALGLPPIMSWEMGPVMPMGKAPGYDDDIDELANTFKQAISEGALEIISTYSEISPGSMLIGSVGIDNYPLNPQAVFWIFRSMAADQALMRAVVEDTYLASLSNRDDVLALGLEGCGDGQINDIPGLGAYQQSCPLGVLLTAPLQSYSEMSVMPSRCGIEWSSTSGQPPRIERPAPGRG
jgi:hypothetical protein